MSSEVEQVLERVRETIHERSLLPPEGGLIVIGYSGGADSTSLLHALHTLRAEFRLRLHAAHLHHGMRPEGDQDAEVCKAFCARLGIPITIERVNVPEMAQRWRVSIEEAGRRARYEFFERVTQQIGATHIATAHTRNDQVETILLNLLRGTGLRGLRGIPYRRGSLIRPLLEVPREWTVGYCQALNLPVCFDATNLDLRYLRNRLRQELMPLLSKLAPGFEERVLRLARIIESEEEWLEEQAQNALRACLLRQTSSSLWLDADKVRALHLALQRRLLRLVVSLYLPGGELPTFEAIERILHALQAGEQFSWSFGGGLHVVAQPEVLFLHRARTRVARYDYLLTPGEPLWIPEAQVWVGAEKSELSAPFPPKDGSQAWVDADRLEGSLTIRNRRPGDRFQPLGLKGTRRLTDVFIDRKWDRDWRDRCPLFSDGQGLIWVPGYTIADRVKITPETRAVLRLYIQKGGVGEWEIKACGSVEGWQ